jgi:CheY-like chemotaxis protein
MDVQMPEMDGIEATRQIRALPGAAGRTHIIAMTASAMTGAEAEYRAAGMDDYISKPVDIKSLREKLAAIRPMAGAATDIPATANSPASASFATTLDAEKLTELQQELSHAKVIELAAMFLDDIAHQLERIETCRVQADYPAMGIEAHTLVSTAGNIGATQLSAAARELEHACRKHDGAAAAELATEVVLRGAAASSDLHRWLDEQIRSVRIAPTTPAGATLVAK